MDSSNRENSSRNDSYTPLQGDEFATSSEYRGGDEPEVVSGAVLSYKDRLLLELQRDWICNSISNLRDTGRAILGPIGFLLGFYGVLISIGVSSGLIVPKAIGLPEKLMGIGPPALWVLALFFSLISIRPTSQRVEGSIEEIEYIFDRHARRIRACILLALSLFFIGTLWFIVLLGAMIF